MSFWWIGPRAWDTIGMHRILRFAGIASCDWSAEERRVIEETGAAHLSVESRLGARRSWSTDDHENAVRLLRDSEQFRSAADRDVILPFRSYRALAELQHAFDDRLTIAAPDPDVVARLDHKHGAFIGLASRGISQPYGRVCSLDGMSYSRVRDEFGERLVVKQTASGSGSGTRLVFGEADYHRVAGEMRNEPLLVNEFVDGPSYNVHGMVTREGIFTSPPSIQLVGIQGCTDQSSVYCGNDFSACGALDPALLQAIDSLARDVGAWLGELGYRGIFGLDLVGTGDRLVVVDVNPRFQGSTPLLTQAELLAGRTPFVWRHVLEFLRDQVGVPAFKATNEQACPRIASQIIVHAQIQGASVAATVPRPGVYIPGPNDRPTFVRPALSILDGLNDGEFLLTASVVRPGSIVEPGAEMLKVIIPNAVLNLETGRLAETPALIMKQVVSSIDFRPI